MLFLLWVPYIVLFKVKKADSVIFMDFETAFLGLIAAKLKGSFIIFDVVDPISQTKLIQFETYGLNKYVDWLELKYATFADMAVVPHDCRIQYYKDRINSTFDDDLFHVVENVPSYHSNLRSQVSGILSDHFVIGYFGTLDYNSRGLEFLIQLAMKYPDKISVIIAGQGGMSHEIELLSREINNVDFKGRFNQETLVGLYGMIDYTWAFYSSAVPLHKYAAPNKFYEHLFFDTPIITTAIVPQSKIISEIKTGVIINDSCEDGFTEEAVFHSIMKHHEQYGHVANVAGEYWRSHYENYYEGKRKHYWILFQVMVVNVFSALVLW